MGALVIYFKLVIYFYFAQFYIRPQTATFRLRLFCNGLSCYEGEGAVAITALLWFYSTGFCPYLQRDQGLRLSRD